jgi:hypothetical protein
VNVVAVEMGERPLLMTKSRMFAPEGVKLLAEVLGHMTFAEDAIVVLDWSNETKRQPDEVAKPVVFITTLKRVGERTLTVEVRLDVEDTFGRDELIAEDFLVIIRSMEDKMNSTIAQSQED